MTAKKKSTLSADGVLEISLSKALIALAVVASGGSAFGLILYNQSSTSQEVKSLYLSQEKQEERRIKMSEEFMKMMTSQDERRSALGKEFLSSNDKIATKVGELTTILAVQQAQAKTTTDAMAKISSQLEALTRGTPRR